MSIYKNYVGKQLIVGLPGVKLEGILVDYGHDLAVLYNEEAYIYIPTAHIHHCRLNPENEGELVPSSIRPFLLNYGTVSYKQILSSAKDLFIEIAVLGKELVYGSIAEILEDYFVFFSPIHKKLLVPFEHLKWLALLSRDQTYYSLKKDALQNLPTIGPLESTFRKELQSLVGSFVSIDLSNSPHKSGLVKEVTNDHLQLITSREEAVWHNLKHVQVLQPL